MFLVNEISTGLILVELFYFLKRNEYHLDYFSELRNHVKDIERINPNIGAKGFCLEVMSRYLYSSNNRFKFAKKFVTFCKELSI